MLKLIAGIIALCGVIIIYDARLITLRYFNFGEQNDATTGLKVLGFVLAIVGAILFYIFIR